MLDLTSNLVNAAKKSGVKYIIKHSVMGADAEPGITPGRLPRQAEKIIEESAIPFSFLRPNFFMQNFVNFYSPMIKSQGALYAPAGDGKVSFVDVTQNIFFNDTIYPFISTLSYRFASLFNRTSISHLNEKLDYHSLKEKGCTALGFS
jgi:hypothetical protein